MPHLAVLLQVVTGVAAVYQDVAMEEEIQESSVPRTQGLVAADVVRRCASRNMKSGKVFSQRL